MSDFHQDFARRFVAGGVTLGGLGDDRPHPSPPFLGAGSVKQQLQNGQAWTFVFPLLIPAICHGKTTRAKDAKIARANRFMANGGHGKRRTLTCNDRTVDRIG